MPGVIGASRGLAFSIAAAVGMCPAVTYAQSYPTKPVRYDVPFAAGSNNDIVGRLHTFEQRTRPGTRQSRVDRIREAENSEGHLLVFDPLWNGPGQ